MPTTNTYEQKIIVPVAITDRLSYIEARKQADTAEEFNGLKIANMPKIISLLKDEKIAKAVREYWADSITGEYHTTIDSDKMYIAAHGEHPFANTKRLEKGWNEKKNYGFMPVTPTEAKKLSKNLVSIVDVRTGYDASNQNIAINLEKDNPVIHPSGQLPYDKWMKDDRVLAICGSEENRTLLGEFLFKTEKKRATVGSYHGINDVSFDESSGRLVWLGVNNYVNGIYGYSGNYNGRFVGDSAGGASAPTDTNAKLLEHRVMNANKTGMPFEYNGIVYAPVKGVKLD